MTTRTQPEDSWIVVARRKRGSRPEVMAMDFMDVIIWTLSSALLLAPQPEEVHDCPIMFV